MSDTRSQLRRDLDAYQRGRQQRLAAKARAQHAAEMMAERVAREAERVQLAAQIKRSLKLTVVILIATPVVYLAAMVLVAAFG